MDRFEQLNRGNLRGRDWEDVAAAVTDGQGKSSGGKSVEQCKNKIDNLKKRYKVECQRIAGSASASLWPWYKQMEQIMGNSPSPGTPKPPAATNDKARAAGARAWSSVRIRSTTSRSGTRYPSSGTGHTTTMVPYSRSTPLSNPKWKRVLLKIGGTALAGEAPHNVDPKVIMLIAREVQVACRHGVEVAILMGGRNVFCADSWVAATGTDRASTHPIGMMAAVMNAVLLQASLEKIGVETRVQTALMMQEVAEPYIRRRAIRHLEKGRVVIFGGTGAGTGNPLFTTDTAAALRASEINADVVLKGVIGDDEYGCPPRSNGSAPFEHISFRELAARGTSKMDMTAITCCEENNIPVVIFNMLEPGNMSRAICGDQVGTLVDQSGRIT
uniref:UMP kinase n=1 Tax=Aegilops tauschii TaxID=37682 RepID=M8BI42_AEGTA